MGVKNGQLRCESTEGAFVDAHMLLFGLIWTFLRLIIARINSIALLSLELAAMPSSNCPVIDANIANGITVTLVFGELSYVCK